MVDVPKKCSSCGRPLPAGYEKKRCEACIANRRAMFGKVVTAIGAVASAAAGVAVFVLKGGRR